MRVPAILRKELKKLSVLPDYIIEEAVEASVQNGDTFSMLIGRVTNTLLANKAVRHINNGTARFKKVLMMRVNEIVKEFEFTTITENKTIVTKDGDMVCIPHTTIVADREQTKYVKQWFKEPTDYQDYVVMKGSGKVFDNNSTALLEEKSSINLMVKNVNPVYIDLYAVLLYEDTKAKVTDSGYMNRLKEVSAETKGRIGYIYKNMRKLDSNSRNYPLNRNGFAYEYGDAFEKWLVEPARPYLVDANEVKFAKKYLRNEFGVKTYKPLVIKAQDAVIKALADLEEYNKGFKVSFDIDHKELGKLLHIIDVNENIIENEGGYSTSCVGYDFTNSGGINAANQFGDKKLMRVANLLGEDEKFDTHQAVADWLGMKRDDAKSVMQGPNHGGRVVEEHKDMVTDIFGDSYKYIHMMAQYGMKLADAGVVQVELERPDGVKAVWYPYSIGCKVPMEDGTVVDAIMPYNPYLGKAKHRSLAVTILHSSDAYTEAHIMSGLLAEGIHIKSTLDCFYTRPSTLPLIKELTFEALEIMEGYAEQQLQSIEKQTGIMRDGWTLPERECELVPSYNVF